MNYVDGRTMIIMDNVNDRMRLKDKIVANVAKAVKSIQELHSLSGCETVKLSNYDQQCHRLCEHLDHTLLHGLRHVTPGYWKLVTEFTHKDCIKDIKRMINVTTDLGRGRAWLFMALNDCLLESYLRCYQQNDDLVEEYYVKDALVRDQDRFNVLLTLTSGLENTVFELECDMPYLDLCVYPPKSRRHSSNMEPTVEYDKMSVCSMESLHMPTRPLPQAVFESQESYEPVKDTCSTCSGDSHTAPCGRGHSPSLGRGHSPSLDSGVHSDWNFRQRSITPIEHLDSLEHVSLEGKSSELEVIRLTKKGKPAKHKKKKKRFVSVNSVSEQDGAVPPDVPEEYKGPVIEIPPLDDFKLETAIKISCNNNEMTKSPMSLSHSDMDSSWASDLRSQGDGVEDDSDGVFGNNPNPSAINVGNTIDSNDTEQDNNETKHTSNRDSGIFTEMIKAKVSSIVDAGEKLENESNSQSEQIGDNSQGLDKLNVNKSDTNSVQYVESIGNDGTYVSDRSIDIYLDQNDTNGDDIYNGESVDTSVSGDKTENDPQEPKQDAAAPEELSIYSRGVDYELDDEDDSFDVDDVYSRTTTPSRLSNSSTPSRISANKTPEKSLESSPQKSVKNARSESLPKLDDKNNKSSDSRNDHILANRSSAPIFTTNQGSSHSEHENLYDRNTPENINYRKSSVSSKSSLESFSSNQMSSDRNASRDSPNQQSPYKCLSNQQSPYRPPSSGTDDEKASENLQAKVEELINQRKLRHFTHLTFEDDDMEDGQTDDVINFGAEDRTPRGRADSLRPGEVELDNNSMLYLMLDILEGEETFVKMFCCRQGHTEGKTSTVYLLLTTNCLYILTYQEAKKRFKKNNKIPYTDIDFVTLGFNSQILHIACKNKRHKYWFTTGEEKTTVALVDCLADSMEKCDSKPGRLEVDTDNLAQKISLQKYVTKETGCDPEESGVLCYSLVHWEDPDSAAGSCESDRETILYYKSNETTNILGTQTWRVAYAVLKDCMLCLYNDKNDSKPVHFLSMRGDECVGCKRDFNSDKNHSIKIVLADGSYWSLALETDAEANSWIQGLCHAVSEGLQMNPVRASCVPCCLVLCKEKLLMCHEDQETNFLRTLGSASLPDVTGLLQDDLNTSFIVVAFDSLEDTIDSVRWVLYFNSDYECSRFRTTLSQAWSDHYQIEVPVQPIENFAFQKKLRDMAKYLKNSLTLR